MESATLKFRESTVKAKPLPRHVGIIMDGNGRWAEMQGRPRIEGHREGSASVREVTRCARRTGIEALTLYAFSSQNWKRPSLEVTGLMELLREYLIKERAEIMENGIRLNAIGALERLPAFVRTPLEALREDSAGNKGMVLTLALSYGGREELVQAMQAVARRVENGELSSDSITEADVERELWTCDLPPVDLIIRSSGENRVSNFLLWQGAYAEYVFTETLWPDFRGDELLDCIERYQNRERRFGLTSAQLRALP
ncbi:MAG: di-trans,poly-cis-decaprenylcistransferase [Myxococcaceae bacterium]|nr:di-trans,poly-cis-decaprenylcistransferase [Myxococcaceae bacterium]